MKKIYIFVKYWPLNCSIVHAESTKLDAEKAETPPPKKVFCNDQTMTPLSAPGNIDQSSAEDCPGGRVWQTHQPCTSERQFKNPTVRIA